ncbi:MAG: hydroxymethylglutaryl-CoA reductase, degradative [Legionella sp.]|nr:hydroxymethylglutaryl-CoA reductase, degradative [Legionella sp.]
MPKNELFNGFSKLSRLERFNRLREMGALTDEDLKFFEEGGLKNNTIAENLIENAIGYFQLPLGVVTNFIIDDHNPVIPMAVEETSIIAALSKTAKWINEHGTISTSTEGDCIIGQIQIAQVKDFHHLESKLLDNKPLFIELANSTIAAGLFQRGGGVKDLYLRKISCPNGDLMAIIHLTMDPVDAMGANVINQVLEYLKAPIEELTHETVTMCILSNLNDLKLTKAEVVIQNVGEDLGQRIEQASIFAELDPYRAATHNKGVLNGIDPVLIATGNDWRAVEASIHSYAARDGQYRAVTRWRYSNNTLSGEFKAPIVVGIAGGVTSIHPTAKIGLQMLGVKSAKHLSRIVAAVGLVQNLGALRALCSEGIIQGHMKLHLTNLMMMAGADEHERGILRERIQPLIDEKKRISPQHLTDLLLEIRGKILE